MNMRQSFISAVFLFAAFAMACGQPGLAADKKSLPGAGQVQQGKSVSVPLACSRSSGTCICSGSQDCTDLAKSKLCDGDTNCQSSGGTINCSCKYKAPQ